MNDRIEELFEEAHCLPHGPEQVAVMEEVVRLVDAENNEEMAFGARIELVDAANWAGMHDKALVAFSWCLSRFDRMQDEFDSHDILWRFKWILQNIAKFSGVSDPQIRAMEDDLAQRLDAEGYSARPIEYIRCLNRVRMGQLDEARRDFERWQNAKRDAMADCRACEQDNEVEFHAALGEDERALELAHPLVTAKRDGCAEVPHHTFGHIARPLLRLDRLDEAAQRHKAGMRRIAGQDKFVRGVAEQMLLLIRDRDVAAALGVVDKHVGLAMQTVDEDARMRFSGATALALEAAGAESPKKKVKLPESHPLRRDDHTYDLAELAAWFHDDAERLAAAFDARNGNGFNASVIAESRRLTNR